VHNPIFENKKPAAAPAGTFLPPDDKNCPFFRPNIGKPPKPILKNEKDVSFLKIQPWKLKKTTA
jgi:hypothetical protein